MLKYFVLVSACLTLLACGQNVSGTWKGDESGTTGGTSFTATVTVQLQQDGDNVSGTWNSTTGSGGTVSGTMKDGKINPMTISEPSTQTCHGTYTGAASVDGSSMSAALSGDSTCGTVNASLSLTKQ